MNGYKTILLSIFLITNSHANDSVVSSMAQGKAAPAARHVWTDSELKNAKPLPIPKRKLPSSPNTSVFVDQPTGAPGYIPASPNGEIKQETTGDGSVSVNSISTLGYSYPPPFTRYEVFDNYHTSPFRFPYRAVGVLFFRQNGISYRCSASSIGNYAIWTAGHCVSDGAGHWSTDFVFIPAYKDGAPAAAWAQWTSANNAFTTSSWHNTGNLGADMGGVVLDPNATTGQSVSQVLGALGFAWNLPRDQHFTQIGYPAGAPFNGNRMNICASSHSRDDANFVPASVGTGCDMTGGSSGGPWLVGFGQNNTVNGNVSYVYIGQELEMFSPYFDNSAKQVYDALVAAIP